MMRVKVSRRLLNHFRAEGKRVYPREAFAVLIGKLAGDRAIITDLFIPEGQERYASNTQVKVPRAWWEQANEFAKADGLIVLGDIHTHNETSKFTHDTAPSEADWDMESGPLHGICSIRRHPTGRMVARIRFWPADALVETRITE